MTRIEVRPGRDVAAEVNPFLREVGGLGPVRPTDLIFLAFRDDRLVGCLRYAEELGTHVLRSMLIHPESRGQGLGHLLMDAAVAHVEGKGVPAVFCLAYPHLTGFYRAHGFHRVEGDSVPRVLDIRILSYRLQGLETLCLRRTHGA